MITVQLSREALGRTRVAYSPLGEATLSLHLLAVPSPTHLHAPWLQAVRDRLQDVDLELLFSVSPPRKRMADCLTPFGASPQATIEDQLTELARVPADEFARDLTEVWDGAPPARLVELIRAGPDGPALLAEAFWNYWDAALAPYWPRICAVFEDDVAARLTSLVQRGLFAVLDDLHPEVTVDGSDLHIDKPHLPHRTVGAEQFTLQPSIFIWPNLVMQEPVPGRFGLTYAARGVGRVWEGLTAPDERAEGRLAALLGRSRAAILERTSVPISTTGLARELGQAPGSVSQHLTILRDAGLVAGQRSGRSVLYRQTPLAQTIVAAQHAGTGLTTKRAATG